jgi:hypothetical protein
MISVPLSRTFTCIEDLEEWAQVFSAMNDAARFILIRELDAMLKSDYHSKGY